MADSKRVLDHLQWYCVVCVLQYWNSVAQYVYFLEILQPLGVEATDFVTSDVVHHTCIGVKRWNISKQALCNDALVIQCLSMRCCHGPQQMRKKKKWRYEELVLGVKTDGSLFHAPIDPLKNLGSITFPEDNRYVICHQCSYSSSVQWKLCMFRTSKTFTMNHQWSNICGSIKSL